MKSGRDCEGYERYPVFLNRTHAGLERRPHLAEAKVAPLDEVQIVSWFWENHTKQGWMFFALQIANPTPTLKQSLKALSVTRYGRTYNNEQWMRRGRSLYSEALSTLQKTLHKKPFHDETLASARCLVLYEYLESTSGNPNAWETHLSGLERLLLFRGRGETVLARKVFEDCRYPLMCKAIMRRERSPFCEKEWLLDDDGQLIWNYGFEMAALLSASENGEDVREWCRNLYVKLEDLKVGDVIHRWCFKLYLLMLMEKIGEQRGDQEGIAQQIFDAMKEVMMGDFWPQRALMPVNMLVWFYRGRERFKECLQMKQRTSDRGTLFARDVNKCDLPVVKIVRS